MACDLLDIQRPEIIIGGNFPTKTTRMMAVAGGGEWSVRLNIDAMQKFSKSELDIYSETFHECRHLYQIGQINSDKPIEPEECIEGWRRSLDEYKQSDKIQIDAYNDQLIEIDAFAFASVAMQIYFKLKMTLDFNKTLEVKVNDRGKQIFSDLKQRGIIA